MVSHEYQRGLDNLVILLPKRYETQQTEIFSILFSCVLREREDMAGLNLNPPASCSLLSVRMGVGFFFFLGNDDGSSVLSCNYILSAFKYRILFVLDAFTSGHAWMDFWNRLSC